MLHFRKKNQSKHIKHTLLESFSELNEIKKIGEEKQNKWIQFIKILAKLCAFNKGIIFHQILCFFYITGYCWIYNYRIMCVDGPHQKERTTLVWQEEIWYPSSYNAHHKTHIIITCYTYIMLTTKLFKYINHQHLHT